MSAGCQFLTVSCSILLRHMMCAELASHSFEWRQNVVVMQVDLQHAAVPRNHMGHMIAAIENGSAKPIVRVSGPEDRDGIQQALGQPLHHHPHGHHHTLWPVPKGVVMLTCLSRLSATQRLVCRDDVLLQRLQTWGRMASWCRQ